MSHRPPRLDLIADRRIREAAQAAAPGLDVRGPVSKTLGRTDRARTPERTPGAGLTRREHRIRSILLKELEAMHKGSKTWVSYQERKHLFDTLDVGFIDREIAKMERQLRPRPVLVGAMVAFFVVFAGLKVATRLGEPLSWWAALDVAIGFGWPLTMWAAYANSRKALRRRLWIYQALRELSDAEDEGVQLDESVRLADLLIDRIVEAEETAARTPLHRIRA